MNSILREVPKFTPVLLVAGCNGPSRAGILPTRGVVTWGQIRSGGKSRYVTTEDRHLGSKRYSRMLHLAEFALSDADEDCPWFHWLLHGCVCGVQYQFGAPQNQPRPDSASTIGVVLTGTSKDPKGAAVKPFTGT